MKLPAAMTETKRTRTRYWDRPDKRMSKLLDEEVTADPSRIKVDDLHGCDALLERLQEVHGKMMAEQ